MKISLVTKTLVISLAILCSQANAGGMSFKCNGYSFSVYDNETPLEYSMMAGDKIERNYIGKVTRIGNIPITYNYSGKVTAIGNVTIQYNYSGKIIAIGDMSIEYNYSGEITKTSGSIKCNW